MPNPNTDRPKDREVEYEDTKVPPRSGEPQRSKTEPSGAEGSSNNPKLRSDPVSGTN